MRVDIKKGDRVQFSDEENEFLVTLSPERARQVLGDDVVGMAYAEAEGSFSEKIMRKGRSLSEFLAHLRKVSRVRKQQSQT